MACEFFEIGYPKTGTTSLFHAMEHLGFRATNTLIEDGNRPWSTRPDHARDILEKWLNDRYDFEVLDHYEYIGSIFFPVFEEIARMHPASKFILTVRDTDSWLRSVQRFLTGYRFLDPGKPRELNIGILIRLKVLGFLVTTDEQKLRAVFESHTRRVRDHFAGTDRLLVMDVVNGDGWDELCPFVDRPVPVNVFPHSNKSA